MRRRARLPATLTCLIVAMVVLPLSVAGAAAGSGDKRGKGQPAAPKMLDPTGGDTVSGKIKWRVRVRNPKVKRVDFLVDGRVKARRGRKRIRRGKATATINTRSLADGHHTWTARTYGPRGRRSGKARARVRVSNTPSTLFWGASIGPQLTGTQAPWDMNAVSHFEATAGKRLSMLHFFVPFADCASSPCSFYDFPTSPMESVRQHGAIPVLSWSSQSIPSSLDQPDFQLSDVIAGTYDSYIAGFASQARDWGHPFFLRFNWEMNGDWFQWSESNNGNAPGEYVAAWRRVHDIFAAVGATNATWTWCPNVDPENKFQDIASLYPGDAYVDWTCLDGYNWGTNPNAQQGGWIPFDELYESSYREIVDKIAPGKPMLIGETASSEYGGWKADWIEDMLSKVPYEFPKIRGLLWFERFDDNMDWPLETSGSATSAFASGIQSRLYKSNNYGNLAPGPIQPPS